MTMKRTFIRNKSNGELYIIHKVNFFTDCAVYYPTIDSEEVILPNGTWEYAEEEVEAFDFPFEEEYGKNEKV